MREQSIFRTRQVLSFGWLILGVALLVSELTDIRLEFWKPSWLVFGLVAVALAFCCWLAMFFNVPRVRIIGIAGAIAYFLYWAYLFAVSPPEGLSPYLMTGLAVMALAVATVALLLRAKSNGPGSNKN